MRGRLILHHTSALANCGKEGSVSSAVKLTAKERKLLALMLDQAASSGEIHNAATKLAESFRARGVQAQNIEKALTIERLPARQFRPDFGLCVMPWGPNKGSFHPANCGQRCARPE